MDILSQGIKFRQFLLMFRRVDLVDDKEDPLARAPEVFTDLLFLRDQALTAVHHKEDEGRLADGEADLFANLLFNAPFLAQKKSARIDADELMTVPVRMAVMTIPSDPGDIEGDRLPASDDPVEKGRFADIRPADDGDDGFQCGSGRI